MIKPKCTRLSKFLWLWIQCLMIWQANAMVKTSCSFCRLPLCTSSYRHMKFQYWRKKRIPCIFGLAQFFPPPATSTGSNPLLVRIDSFHNSSLVCSSYAHDWARGKMRYMAATARYTANCMQHSRNTTRNTTEMLPGAAFQARTEKLTCMSISLLKKLQNSKMLPLPAFR